MGKICKATHRAILPANLNESLDPKYSIYHLTAHLRIFFYRQINLNNKVRKNNFFYIEIALTYSDMIMKYMRFFIPLTLK